MASNIHEENMHPLTNLVKIFLNNKKLYTLFRFVNGQVDYMSRLAFSYTNLPIP